VLAAPVDAPPDDLPAGTPADEPTPAAMLTWARSTAAAIRAATPAAPGPTGRGAAYGGVPPVAYWGAPPVAAPSLARAGADDDRPVAGRPPDRGRDGSQRAPIVPLPGQRSREARAGDAEPRAGLAAADAPEPSAVEDPRGAPTPAAAGDGGPAATGTHGGTPYPEWDHAARQYRRDAALVRDLPAAAGDGAWADGVLAAHAALVRRVRARFEPLRARRARLGRQPRGDEIDLAAYVDAHADRLAGRGDGDDRLYVATTPARRALAILVLVDVSGSTDARVDGGRRIVDVEREAVLLAAGALDALGDAYAVATFSSRGARDVRVTTLKGFAERDAALFRRRVGAVLPGANTRLGAALRHATALLARQPAGHRLLLLLSDGRPNDMDGYQGPYGVEDARQAVHEARASGVLPFCLTVDREEPEYLAHVFGAAGHTVLRRPDQLPLALVAVVRQLLGAGRS
jgi:nitric oxide reductase NorD protein